VSEGQPRACELRLAREYTTNSVRGRLHAKALAGRPSAGGLRTAQTHASALPHRELMKDTSGLRHGVTSVVARWPNPAVKRTLNSVAGSVVFHPWWALLRAAYGER